MHLAASLCIAAVIAFGHAEDLLEVSWDFEDELEGWAQASALEIGAEVHVDGGLMRGRIGPHGKAPRFDSPLFEMESTSDARLAVAMRIRHSTLGLKKSLLQVRVFDASVESRIDFQSLDVEFGGGNARIVDVPFRDAAVGRNFETILAHFHEEIRGKVIQFRIFPVSSNPSEIPTKFSTWEIDWIKVVRSPLLKKVEGCIDKGFENRPQLAQDLREDDGFPRFRGGHENGTGFFTVEEMASNNDGHLQKVAYFESFPLQAEAFEFGTTFNCPHRGGQRIRVSGLNFGDDLSIFVDGISCEDALQKSATTWECTLPNAPSGSRLDPVSVKVQLSDFPGLVDNRDYLSFAVPPPKQDAPLVANIASRSVDLSWLPPEHEWDALSITGHRINVIQNGILVRQICLGNVFTTSVVNLTPSSSYKFSVSPLLEDMHAMSHDVDLYGRRPCGPILTEGHESNRSASIETLAHDFTFRKFGLQETLNQGPTYGASIVGPSRNTQGEGHFGLTLVGNAHVMNCNSSSACCDFDGTTCDLICVNVASSREVDPFYKNMTSDRDVTSNINGNVYIGPPRDRDETAPLSMDSVGARPLPQCGPVLSLTGSAPFLSGSAYYSRKMNVREGFETEFTFEISNPSLVCRNMDDIATHCRSRGADGFAFVVQNDGALAVGKDGSSLGFEGIQNAMVVEFDTFSNHEKMDPYENHVAVFASGKRAHVSSDHRFELASTNRVPDLTDGPIVARIRYIFNDPMVSIRENHFRTTLQTTNFIHDQENPWNHGTGTLQVLINGQVILSTLLNLDQIIDLDSGRAFVGFSAATGSSFFQAHQIRSWTFTSVRG